MNYSNDATTRFKEIIAGDNIELIAEYLRSKSFNKAAETVIKRELEFRNVDTLYIGEKPWEVLLIIVECKRTDLLQLEHIVKIPKEVWEFPVLYVKKGFCAGRQSVAEAVLRTRKVNKEVRNYLEKLNIKNEKIWLDPDNLPGAYSDEWLKINRCIDQLQKDGERLRPILPKPYLFYMR